MKIRIARWYVVLVVRLPGRFGAEPACIGFGLPRYADKAHAVALDLARELV